MKVIVEILYHGTHIDSRQYDLKAKRGVEPIIKIDVAPKVEAKNPT